MVNITGVKQSLLRKLLRRADYATLDLKPEAGADHAAETALIEQIRSGMIQPDGYPASTTSDDTQGLGELADQGTISLGQAHRLDQKPAEERCEPEEQIEFAASSNGDRWFLCGQRKREDAFVLHRANPASGGHETRRSVDAFLALKPNGPEHEALHGLLQDR
ncbi:hypothetical protein KX729_32585 [Rhizobium sp. XQZ8]|uniref:hypothetical protein n=1 Tax=Rhizobium populisoli TaxID=2859785 RepID=UPI001CA58407|nr:hypothetical protein [Rhizobium populisoli]MBW6426103.1 hypothetical protein [Rhizobium populisoli]